jgi:hypothetical protein
VLESAVIAGAAVTVGRLQHFSTSTSSQSRLMSVPEVSTIEVVTFSGVTSGGIVTSGTTCWTCRARQSSFSHSSSTPHGSLTFDTNDSLMSEVMMVDFPTPSSLCQTPLRALHAPGGTYHLRPKRFGRDRVEA